MNRIWSKLLATVFFACAATVAMASVKINMPGVANWDGYISTAEHTESQSYNPPGDWGLAGRMVRQVFGEHSFPQWSYGNRIFAWQAQVGSSYTGLPDDGQITAGSWDYQLAHLNKDAAPSGGWGNPEYTKPTTPTGLLPLADNTIYVYRPHTGIPDPATANYTATFAVAEQGYYTGVNMLMHGNAATNRLIRIYAVYDDGEDLRWTGNVPTPDQTLDPTTYPSHADLAVAYTTNRGWSNVGSPAYNTLGNFTARLFHFQDGLALNPARKLTGLRFHFVPQTYAAADFAVYAITLIPEPATAGLFFGGLALMALRRRIREKI